MNINHIHPLYHGSRYLQMWACLLSTALAMSQCEPFFAALLISALSFHRKAIHTRINTVQIDLIFLTVQDCTLQGTKTSARPRFRDLSLMSDSNVRRRNIQ